MNYFQRIKKWRADTGGFPIFNSCASTKYSTIFIWHHFSLYGRMAVYLTVSLVSLPLIRWQTRCPVISYSHPFEKYVWKIYLLLSAMCTVGLWPILKKNSVSLLEAQPHSCKLLDVFSIKLVWIAVVEFIGVFNYLLFLLSLSFW